MGSYKQGILGNFSGKIGPVIGGSWKGVQYMRSRSSKRGGKASPKILAQRAKFKLASDFASTLKDLLTITFPQYTNKTTARNQAMKSLLDHAVTGEYPDFRIEYSKVKLANGSLSATMMPAASSTDQGIVKFSWKNSASYGNAKADDKAILIVYNEQHNICMYLISDFKRSDMSGVVDVANFSGLEVHTWISFISADGVNVADSIYTGALTVA